MCGFVRQRIMSFSWQLVLSCTCHRAACVHGACAHRMNDVALLWDLSLSLHRLPCAFDACTLRATLCGSCCMWQCVACVTHCKLLHFVCVECSCTCMHCHAWSACFTASPCPCQCNLPCTCQRVRCHVHCALHAWHL